MAEINKAFVYGGFSEDTQFLAAFTNALCTGPDRLFDEAEAFTWAQVDADFDKLSLEARRRALFPHSAGAMLVKHAALVATLNGVEPTPIHKTIWHAKDVASNHEIGREAHVTKSGILDAAVEVFRHPSTLKIPFLVRKFSTVQMLIDGGEKAFPGGRLYLPTRQDEFGFGGEEEVALAQANGITAELLEGFHNQPLVHPIAAVRKIGQLLDRTN